MSIERHLTEGLSIFIGDGDVLMGETIMPGAVRIWFAPLPDGFPIELDTVTDGDARTPPSNTAATLFFVKRESLEQFIALLQRGLKAFGSVPNA